MATTPLDLKKAAQEIGAYGLKRLSPAEMTKEALASSNIHHMKLALFTVVNFNYSDKRQADGLDIQKFPEYFTALLDGVAAISPYEAITVALQSYITCDSATIDYLNFDDVILPAAHKYISMVDAADIEKTTVLLASEQLEASPPTDVPLYYEMLHALVQRLAGIDVARAKHLSDYMLETLHDVPLVPGIYGPYATKPQPKGETTAPA